MRAIYTLISTAVLTEAVYLTEYHSQSTLILSAVVGDPDVLAMRSGDKIRGKRGNAIPWEVTREIYMSSRRNGGMLSTAKAQIKLSKLNAPRDIYNYNEKYPEIFEP